jgi:hypothetical protein
MSLFIRFSKSCLVFIILVSAWQGRAALVWDGPSITYTQPAPDPTQPANQDRLTPNVWLTRTNSGGLFNAFSETLPGAVSPADTEWAFGAADQYRSLTFTNWLGWLNGQSPTTLVGKQSVVHFISEDIYISMKFTLWASKGAGGFAYIRSTPPVAPMIWNLNVTNGFEFNYSTTAGSNYVVDASADLLTWLPQVTNSAASTVGMFQESSSSAMRFYRVKQVTP